MKKFSSKMLSLFLTLVMVCSFTLSSVGPVVTYAEGEGGGENQGEIAPGGEDGPGLEEEASPYDVMSFYDMYSETEKDCAFTVSENATAERYEKRVFTIGPWKEHLAEPYMDYGVLVKAEQGKATTEEGQPEVDPMTTVTVTLNDEIDFGEDVLDRVEFNGLAKTGSKATVEILLDDKTEPIGSMTMYNQTAKDDWRKSKGYSFDVSAAKITGKHKVSVRIQNAGEKLEVLIRSIQFIQESIPVVNIDIDESKGSIKDMNADPTHATECYGKMYMHVPDGYVAESEAKLKPEKRFAPDPKGYKMEYIRGRGNSTWTEDKKPYKIKLDKKTDFFNMGESKHWVLIANYYDNSLVRNRMTYQLGKDLGYKYTPECVSVDVVMNGEYLGNYLLCEQIRVEESRVNITDLEKAYEKATDVTKIDLSGGYLISNSPYGGELGYGFETPEGNSFYLESPESEYDTTLFERTFIGDGLFDGFEKYGEEVGEEETEAGEEEAEEEEWVDDSKYAAANAYIKNYICDLESAIYADDYEKEGSDSYKKVAEMMDINSAVQYYWMQELSRNGDAFVCPSTYLYKEKNGKLYWGPLWDFDYVAWGSTDYSNYEETQPGFGFDFQRVWFEQLMRNPTFAKKVKDYWTETLSPALAKVIADGGMLDQFGEELAISANNNFQKWGFSPMGFGEDSYYGYGYYGNYGVNDDEDVAEGDEEDLEEEPKEELVQTYEYEINRLKSWIQYRKTWIDENLKEVAPREVAVKFVVDGKAIYETTGYTNCDFTDFPEEPIRDGMRFVGWNYISTYEAADEETGEIGEYEETNDFDKGQRIDFTMLNDDDEFILTAEFISEDEILDIDNVIFEKDDYYMVYSPDDYYEIRLNHTILPVGAEEYTELEWSSDNEKVAIAYAGFVASTGVGDAKITAKTPEGKAFSVMVHVISEREYNKHQKNYTLQDFTMEETKLSLQSGEGQKVGLITEPATAISFNNDEEEGDYMWLSSDESVVTVNNMGYVFAEGPGTATVLAYNRETRTIRSCTVTVDGEKNPGGDNGGASINKGDQTNNTAKPGAGNGAGTGNGAGNGNATGNGTGTTTTEAAKDSDKASVKVGTTFTAGNLKYKVTVCKDKDLQVEVTGAKKSKATISIPATVKYENKTYKITTIGKSAFANDKKLKTVNIGKNIIEIKSKAFAKCKKLKTIKVSSKVLKKVGKNAFKGIAKNANVKVPKAKKKAYKKLFKGLKVK